MIRLADAITNRFPQGNQWATDALAALSGGLEPTTLVHDVVEGWTRIGDGDGAELVDTLFILTSDRLGLGQAGGDGGTPRWIPLRSIVAVDAVDNSPLPLQTIELEIGDAAIVCVGWPETFSDRLVPVLVALANGDDPDLIAPADTAPAPPTPTADPFPVAPEPPVDAAPGLPPILASDLVEPPTQRPIVAALDFLNKPAPTPFPAAAPPTPDLDEIPLPPPPAPMTAPAPPPPSPAPSTLPGDAAPWLAPGMVWPEPLRGVLYLGGHPGYPRKRKNGTMAFSPNGLDVSGTGFQSWDMSMDWAFVHGLEVQGPDEIMFADHLKIDSTSSALVVTMTDDTRMFFEIRTRRPPSLRATLAPVLTMVENIRSYRANR
jgi:hypothetical protein